MNKINKVIKKVYYCLIILLLGFVFFVPFASWASPASKGLSDTATKAFNKLEDIPFADTTGTATSIPTIAGQLVGYLLQFTGIIFMVLIIYAGFKWMTARGNDAEAKKAQELIYQATIGLIIVLSAYAITAFVGKSLTTAIS
jgi:hypothetical protein